MLKSAIPALAIAISTLGVSAPAYADGYYVNRSAYVIGVSNRDVLYVRAWPASYSRRVGAIGPHTDNVYVQRCKRMERGSDWCKINYRGMWGWVNSRFLAYH